MAPFPILKRREPYNRRRAESKASFPHISSFARDGQRRKRSDVVAFIDLPDGVDQWHDIVARIPARGGIAQLVFKVLVAHRVGITAARRKLRKLVGVAV